MKLYAKYFLLHLKSIMEYKMSFILTIIGQFLVSFNAVVGMYFMFQRFEIVEGYTFPECLLCYSIFLLGFSLSECFFRGFDQFSSMIGNGEFDRILLRPRNIVLQILGSKIEFSRIGRMIQAIVMFLYGIVAAEIDWTGTKVFTVFSMLVGGVVIFSSVYVLYAGICFFTLEGLEVLNMLTDGAREFGMYPFNIYGKGIVKFLTYFVPYALIQYYPFLYLIDRNQKIWVPLLPMIACVFVVPCFIVWQQGLRHYQSTGS